MTILGLVNNMDKYWEQFVFAIIVLAVAFIISRLLRLIIGRFLRAAAKKLKVDPTRYNFFKNAIDSIVLLIAAITIFRSIPAFKDFGTTLLTGAGVLAAIVGFASQAAFSNIISGIFLVIFKPFSVGDRVKIGSLYSGDVEDITLRHTVIKDFENRRVVIPNSVISNETIINSTLNDERVCMFIEFNISFDSDIDLAMQLIQADAIKHPLCIDGRAEDELRKGEHQVMVRTVAITDFAMQLRAYAWTKNAVDGFELKCDLYKSVKQQFDKNGIEIPFPYRTILYKNEKQEKK